MIKEKKLNLVKQVDLIQKVVFAKPNFLWQIKGESKEVRSYLKNPEETMLVAFAAASHLSGMSFSEMKKDGGLVPAALFYYALAIKFDSECDDGKKEGSHLGPLNMAISQMDRLGLGVKARKVAEDYKRAEKKLLNKEYFSDLPVGYQVLEAAFLREEGFGKVARLMTDTVCLKRLGRERCDTIGEKLSYFAVTTGVLDAIRDVKKDKGNCVTVATAGLENDRIFGYEEGTTAEVIYKDYLQKMDSPELAFLANQIFGAALLIEEVREGLPLKRLRRS